MCIRDRRYRDLDSQYLIKSGNPAFTQLILPGSNLADLLLQTRAFRVRIEPVAEEKHLHTVQVLREKSLGSEIQGKTISLEELPPVSYTHLDVYKRQALLR